MDATIRSQLCIINLLASLGASPNGTACRHALVLAAVWAEKQASARVLLQHVISTFHPAAAGITCHIPLDSIRVLCVRLVEQPRELHLIADIITHANAEQRIQQLDRWHRFMRATHPLVGRDSAVRRVLCSSPLYEPRLWRLVLQYVYVKGLPSTVEALDELAVQR